MPQYFIVYKPYQVLTQFSSTENKVTLKDFFEVSKDVYPVGRLDYDSEGLLILTNDTSLNHRLLHPSFKHEREYWAQVDGMPSTHVLQQLMKGVDITVDGKKYRTKHCIASLFDHAPIVPERNPPIRFRKEIPAPWIRLILQEGKNRQVRKMTAAIGHPTLRLIRYRIEDITLEQLQPGEMKELSQKVIYKKIFHE